MFYGCTNLKSIPEGITLGSLSSGRGMFNRCSSLAVLPSTLTLASLADAYQMFYNCTSLVSLPSAISLRRLNDGGYMFYGCSLDEGSVLLILGEDDEHGIPAVSETRNLDIGKRAKWKGSEKIRRLLGVEAEEIEAGTYNYKGWNITVH